MNKRHKILLRFGHAENIYPLITSLGLFKDAEHLNANNFEKHANRKFRSGSLNPFSSNVAFVINKCTNDYKISLFVNELPVGMLNAGELKCVKEKSNEGGNVINSSVCDYADLKLQLEHYLNLNFDETCQSKNKKIEL